MLGQHVVSDVVLYTVVFGDPSKPGPSKPRQSETGHTAVTGATDQSEYFRVLGASHLDLIIMV